MSLKINRFKKKTEDWIVTHVQKLIKKESGEDMPFTIDWDSFGDIGDNEEFLKRGTNYAVLEGNIRSLCRDELGKSAFKEYVKAIIVQHTDSEDLEEVKYTLKEGTLTYIANQKKRVYGSTSVMDAKMVDLF